MTSWTVPPPTPDRYLLPGACAAAVLVTAFRCLREDGLQVVLLGLRVEGEARIADLELTLALPGAASVRFEAELALTPGPEGCRVVPWIGLAAADGRLAAADLDLLDRQAWHSVDRALRAAVRPQDRAA